MEQLAGLRLQVVDGVLDTLRAAASVNADLLRREDVVMSGSGAEADMLLT